MSDVDWLAISWVCSGTPIALTDDERRMAVRRMVPRMVTRAEVSRDLSSADWLARGRFTAEEVGRRIGVGERQVYRIRDSLPAADTDECPVCRERIWVVAGVAEEHPDRLLNECPMSGREMPVQVDRVVALLHRMAEVIERRRAA
ncbi:hypothetical protein ACAG26_24195 [Mycobacterium sp. pUA109]|uniref:DUF7368 family protein n=1 Tax=Mycobacterium sp. pUA109 TaxID=3238982 RepID=UPI00351B0B18